MATVIAAEACKMLGIGGEVGDTGIDDAAGAPHQTGKAWRPTPLARGFENEPQPLLNQILELAAAQRGFRFGPAVKIIRDFDGEFHRIAPLYPTTILI